jgi:hypothetical protein
MGRLGGAKVFCPISCTEHATGGARLVYGYFSKNVFHTIFIFFAMSTGGFFSGADLRSQPKVFPHLIPSTNDDTGKAFEDTLAPNHRKPHELPPKPSIAKPTTGGLAGQPLPEDSPHVEDVDGVQRFEAFEPSSLPPSAVVLCVAARRSGKSVLINWILQKLQNEKRFTHVFLISASGASFKGIPKRFRGKSLAGLNWIVEKTKEIGKHNKKLKKQSEMHHNRVAVVCDDCGHLAGGQLHKSEILKEIAMIGRHYSYPTGDALKTNSFSLFLLTQSLTSVSPAFRRNVDVTLINNIASANELNACLEESGFYNFCHLERRRDARAMFQELIRQKPYRFIAIENWRQPKTDIHEYFKLADADAEYRPDKRLFGTASDDESDPE